MKSFHKSASVLCTGAALVFSTAAHATNGMNLEGYGPVALGMGGAGFAYDAGTSATMMNPATMGLAEDGTNRLDLALGFLGPDITVSVPDYGMSADSSADAFWMPAMGWMRRDGSWTYGVAVFAQGGMGTEYGEDSFLANPAVDPITGMPIPTGDGVRSEVGVGRFMVPLTYTVNDNLNVGGSLDFVWAGMDIMMAMSGEQFGDFIAGMGGTQTYGTASGGMVDAMLGMMAAGMLTNVDWARIDFSNSSDFTGEARGYGLAGKIGFTYKVNDRLTIGGTYHSKTAISDLNTENATISMQVDMVVDTDGDGVPDTPMDDMAIPVKGELDVVDFQWPATYGIGLSFQATDALMVAMDVKKIDWSGVMSDFNMTFNADADQGNCDDPIAPNPACGFGGLDMDLTMYQDWDDQTVISLGAAYAVNDALTLRVGYNQASNPVPDLYLNPLFPAIVEKHYTFGVGYQFSDANQVNFALSKAQNYDTTIENQGVDISHEQLSWQVMYSHNF